MKKVIDIYLHSGKSDVLDQIEDQGVELSEEAQGVAIYIGYEVKLSVEIDTVTGDNKIVGVDDKLVSGFPFVREEFEDKCEHNHYRQEFIAGKPYGKAECCDCGVEMDRVSG